uniref:RanBD1 domain-containing protein n=1 Tax=Panagrolaimus davidi TaxID=227884 RepID=A0A914PPF5_9BILA
MSDKASFAAAASQLWNQNKSTISPASFSISLKKNEEKTNDESKQTSEATKKSSFNHVFGSGLANKKDEGPKNASQIFQAFAAKKSEGFSNASTSADWLGKNEKKNEPEKLETVEKPKTGEENETNIFQAQCKFYQYDVESKQWKERGLGNLRMNETSDWDSDGKARLVARSCGTQKVLLNSLLFPEMVFESVSEKRIKISAHTPDSELPQLFLIQSTPAQISQLISLLRKRIKEETQAVVPVLPKKRKNEDEDTESINEKTKKLNTNAESDDEDAGDEGEDNSFNDSNVSSASE